MMVQAYVALMAIVTILLAKIVKQLSATANAVIGGIAEHGMDTQGKLVLTLFVDGRHQQDMLFIFASLCIADIRCLLLGNEV